MTEPIRQPLPDGETARDVKFTLQPSRPSNRFEDGRSLVVQHDLQVVRHFLRQLRPTEADATFTVEAMASLIATWTVGVWQNRRLGEHSPAWDPGGPQPRTRCSPRR
ncbi:hypothetical protein [Amycolatopsis sp. lyj-346]|uniref:hypothetical protein n=1 Tax=Amycolatopsis sp. lyj-346 TaxID=2789289 RepID=UPI00397A378D